MKKILQLITHFLLPYTCCLCQAVCKNEQNGICVDCEQKLYFPFLTCERCNREIQTHGPTICGSCLRKPPTYERTVCLGIYQNELRYLITQFKFHNKLFIGKLLSNLLVKKITISSLPECIIPVPLHSKRLGERGFNQSQEIAAVLSKKLSVKVNKRLCKRIRYTAPQSSLKRKDRRKNLKNAFILQGKCHYKHIAIVDDVLTTGQTVEEISNLLKKQGVEKIEIWCLARR